MKLTQSINKIPELEITKETTIQEILKIGSHCTRSGHCCSYSGGFVLEGEILIMAKHIGINEDEFKQRYLDEIESFNTKHFKLKSNKDSKPFGPCIFLKNNLCSIHEVKPLHCRVGSCHRLGEQLSIWFALNYFVNKNDPESIRQWAQYLKTHPSIPGGELHELIPNQEELKKILSYEKLR